MDYKKYTIKNGLRVLEIPMAGVQSATVLILVGVGSRYEEKEINGLSHFLEHMAFKGTLRRPTALEIASTIDGIGGEFNAFTSKDHTGFYIKAASKHILLLFDVLSDMLLHSKFDAVEIEKEKGVIIEEINMYEDTPMRKVGDLYENLLYGDSKLGRDISGKADVIRSINREDFLAYMQRFYSPANTIIAVAGGLESGSKKPHFAEASRGRQELRIKNLIEEYLGNWREKQVEQADLVLDRQDKPQVLVKFKDTQQAHLCIGVRSYKLIHPDRYKLGVLTNILGGGMSSRLFIEVRERRGLAYYIRANNEMYFDVGNFVTQAGVELKSIDDAIKVILEQFERVKKNKVDDGEMNKAKENLKGKLILDLEDSRNMAGLYGTAELLEKEVHTPEEIIKKIDEVRAGDIMKIAKDIFIEKNLNLAVIGPYKEEGKFQQLLKL